LKPPEKYTNTPEQLKYSELIPLLTYNNKNIPNYQPVIHCLFIGCACLIVNLKVKP